MTPDNFPTLPVMPLINSSPASFRDENIPLLEKPPIFSTAFLALSGDIPCFLNFLNSAMSIILETFEGCFLAFLNAPKALENDPFTFSPNKLMRVPSLLNILPPFFPTSSMPCMRPSLSVCPSSSVASNSDPNTPFPFFGTNPIPSFLEFLKVLKNSLNIPSPTLSDFAILEAKSSNPDIRPIRPLIPPFGNSPPITPVSSKRPFPKVKERPVARSPS